jgi:hypothetical protein
MFLIVHTPVLDFILDAVSRWACGVNLLQYARGDLQSIVDAEIASAGSSFHSPMVDGKNDCWWHWSLEYGS